MGKSWSYRVRVLRKGLIIKKKKTLKLVLVLFLEAYHSSFAVSLRLFIFFGCAKAILLSNLINLLLFFENKILLFILFVKYEKLGDAFN